jgi:hypothetical protein
VGPPAEWFQHVQQLGSELQGGGQTVAELIERFWRDTSLVIVYAYQ